MGKLPTTSIISTLIMITNVFEGSLQFLCSAMYAVKCIQDEHKLQAQCCMCLMFTCFTGVASYDRVHASSSTIRVSACCANHCIIQHTIACQSKCKLVVLTALGFQFVYPIHVVGNSVTT